MALQVSSTVVGRNGEILAQVRGDNTGPHTTENSFRQGLYRAHLPPSRPAKWSSASRKSRRSATIHLTNIIANQGALPIKVGDEVIGAGRRFGRARRRKGRGFASRAGIDKVRIS